MCGGWLVGEVLVWDVEDGRVDDDLGDEFVFIVSVSVFLLRPRLFLSGGGGV